MKIYNNHNFNDIIKIPNKSWIEKQRVAGETVAATLVMLENLVKQKTKLTTKELSLKAFDFIKSKDCISTFHNYKGFPGEICISVNKCIVHGNPDNYVLQEGDLVKFDLGATYQGAIADSAISIIYGEPKSNNHVNMISTNNDALYNAIKISRPGNRFGMIGHVISKTISNAGFNVFNEFGGHGIYWDLPHSAPFIANKSPADSGPRIQPGMTFAIEPLIVPLGCSQAYTIADDKWSIFVNDISAHHEHTLYVHEDRTEIITDRTKFYD